MYKAKAYEMLENKVKAMNGEDTISVNDLFTMMNEVRNEAYSKHSTLTGIETAEVLTDFVNSARQKEQQAFVVKLTRSSHRTLQENVFHLFIQCVGAWAKMDGTPIYDARNEYTVKTSAKIVKLINE